MSLKLHRFDFGALRDFGAPFAPEPVVEDTIEEAPLPPPPPTFSEGELEAASAAAKKLGFAEGFEAGLARAAEQLDEKRKMVDTTILQLGKTLATTHQEYRTLIENESNLLSELVRRISEKVIGIGLEQYGADAIINLVETCLPSVLSKPRLIVELHPEMFDATIDRIESLIHTNGFEGELQFRANETLGRHNVTLEWGGGEATRNVEALWSEIENLLANTPLNLTLSSPAETPTA